jgi:DNA mismatch repair protein MSH5
VITDTHPPLYPPVARLDAVLQIRATKEFSKDQGLGLLMDLRAHISSTAQYNAPQLALDAMPLSVSAAHALLSQLQRHARLQQGGSNDEDQDTPTLLVTSIELIALSETMYLSADTRKALCLFDEEDHANVHFAKGKEGLSLFGLLNCVQTPMSRALLRRWLLFPSLSLSVIESRLDAVSLFAEKKRLTEQLRKEVKGTQNIHRLATRLLDGKADLTTWRGVYDFASKCLVIRGLCFPLDNDDKKVGIIKAILEIFTVEKLQRIRHSIEEVIDWNESRLSQRVCVKVGLDAQLDEWRQVYANLPSILNSIVAKMTSLLGDVLDPAYDMYIEYFPQVGYLQALCRKDAGETNEDSIRVGEELGWAYQYSSEVKAYFKTEETKDLDSQLGDLYSFIAGREIEIVQRLYDEVGRYLDWLTACSDVMAELDCLLTFAVVAVKNCFVRPTVTEDVVLDVQDGRHPLQELIVETYVPNDTNIDGGRGLGVARTAEDINSVVVITGANACGKSVYLKQCALIVYMAQIGCFVPARSATIGIVDKSECRCRYKRDRY